jgi:predicted MFS family arabinose efflux permease
MAEEAVAHAIPKNQPESVTAGWELLKTRDFGLLYSGQLISQIGDGLNKVALLWFVYELTGSALKMMVIGLLQTIPPLLFGPLIGVCLDRLPKKTVMIWIDLLRTFLVLLIPTLYAAQALTLELLYVIVFLTAIVSTVFGPALASAIPHIVDRPRLTAANALLQSTTNFGMVMGPAISGLGIALVGAQNVLYLNALTFLISTLCLIPIRTREPLTSPRWVNPSGSMMHDLGIGFRFVFLQHRIVFMLMVTAALYNLGASAFMFLLPVFAKQSLGVGPVELGWLWSILGIGMLAASTCLVWIRQGNLHRRLRIISGSMAVSGLAVGGLGLLETPLIASVFMLIIGGSTALLTPVVFALLQEMTPVPLLGRVFTAFSTGGMACAMAGMMGFGWMADAVGPGFSLLGISLVLLATAVFAQRFSGQCDSST